MASRAIPGSVVGAFPAMGPMPAVARILARFERDQLAGFIAVALDLLDTLDGPEDAEDDDPCGQCDEDGINTDFERVGSGSPGCNISDPDYAVDDKPCDEPYQDRECEQMPQDVPTVSCYAIEPGDNGKRMFVGYWNPASFIGDCHPA